MGFVILALVALFKFFSFKVNAETIKITNVKIDSMRMSFEFINLNSDFSIKGYDYDIEEDKLTIQFYGTIFRNMSLSSNLVIIENAENIKEIRLLVSKDSYITAWESERDKIDE